MVQTETVTAQNGGESVVPLQAPREIWLWLRNPNKPRDHEELFYDNSHSLYIITATDNQDNHLCVSLVSGVGNCSFCHLDL